MKPWLLPVAAIVVAVAWIVWLARGDDVPEVTAPTQRPAAQATAQANAKANAEATAPHEATAVLKGPPAVTAKPAPQPAGAAATNGSAPVNEPALRLSFQSPVSASVGEGFDIRVSLAARQPVRRIAVEITYDPTLLKARSLEEIDYAQRDSGERAFRTEQASDGQIEVVLGDEQGVATSLPMSAPLAQFEPLTAGRTEIRITGITVLDPTNRSLAWAATGRESEVVIR